jgi:mono/diheme cytochrome c family protein
MGTSLGIIVGVAILVVIVVLLRTRAWRPLFLLLGLAVFVLFWAQVVKDQTHPYDEYQEQYEAYLIDLAGGDPAKVEFKPGIVQRYLPQFKRTDRCETCHLGIEDPRFAEMPQPYTYHPGIDTHPTDKFGCTVCHEGVGISVDVEGAHGNKENWRNPILDATLVQSRCVQCHERGASLAGGDVYARGEILFNRVGCLGCHPATGMQLERLPGPDLRMIPSKMRLDWLAGWLKDPNSYLPKTYMPFFDLSDDEIKKLASYLVASAREYQEANGTPDLSGDVPASAANIARGEELVRSVGCLGCHNVDDAPPIEEELDPSVKERNFGPDLSKVGDKTYGQWIKAWVKDPKSLDAKTTMPSLRLTDEDSEAIAAYLQQKGDGTVAKVDIAPEPDNAELVEAGKELVEWYNCAGCHPIAGFEGRTFYGPEITFEGDKEYFRLAFGDKLPEVIRLDHEQGVQSHRSVGHFVKMKLEDPRQFQPGLLKMPDFRFSPAELEALTVFVTSLKARVYPSSYHAAMGPKEKAVSDGREMFARYNCLGCHEYDRKSPRSSGHIRAYYPAEEKALAPPVLHGEGRKVQPLWVQHFIQQPIALRPWLTVRMPTFGLDDKEVQVLSDYFVALEPADHPFYGVNPSTIDKQAIAQGKQQLIAYKCLQCHVLDEIPAGKNPDELAPDLSLTKSRLRPEWVIEWLTNPQGFQPGTRMPNFFFYDELEDEEGEVVVDDKGDPALDYGNETAQSNAEQIQAITDYLMVLDSAEAKKMWAAQLKTVTQ